MKIYKNQIVASTKMDLHGETRPREFFEELVATYPPRMPLHQQHKLELDTIGYLENFYVDEDEGEPGHFVVRADVYVTADDVSPELRGFSISFLEALHCRTDSPIHYLYLPYPLYNDQELISGLLEDDPDLFVGKFVKKALSSDLVTGLIGTGIALLVAPEWQRQYEASVRPAIIRLLNWVPRLREKGASVDFIQRVVCPNGETIELVMVPRRGREERSLDPDKVKEGVSIAFEFLASDPRAVDPGVRRMKLYYGELSEKFILFHIEFQDGSDARIQQHGSGDV